MSLKTRVFLVICSMFLFLALIFFTLSFFMGRGVAEELERATIQENVERALNAIEREIAALDKSAADWAIWDETYDFIEDRNQEYIQKNLLDNTFEILRLNYVALVNAQEQVVYAKAYDPTAGQDLLFPPEVLLPAHHREEGLKGLLITKEGPVLVAARPVLRSDGTGPARGTLIFGRLLRDNNLKELSEITLLTLYLHHPPGAVDLRSLKPVGFLKNGEPFYVQAISPEESAGLAVLKDLEGKPALILQVNSDRSAAKAFRAATRVFGLFLALAAALLCGLGLIWLDRAVLSRLARLTAAIGSTGQRSFPPTFRVPLLKGKDELAFLSREINRMLGRLEEYQRELGAKEQKYRSLVENAAEAIIVVQEGVIVFVNRATSVHTGYTPDKLLSRPFSDFIHPEDREGVMQNYRELLEKETPLYSCSFRILTTDGSVKWVETNSVVIDWEGKPASLHLLTDVTPRKILEEELQRLTAEKSLILDSLTELVVFLDRDMHVIWANRAAGQSVGKNPEGLLGGKCHEIWRGNSTPCLNCPVVRAMESGEVCTGEVSSPDGRFWSITATPVKDRAGNVVGAVETTLEITERKRYEEKLSFLSLHDSLTGLYNRAFFEGELDRLSGSREYPITILVADLDGLKVVNDTLGHAKGDEMLKACAEVLQGSLRRSDILARIGGDEFAAIIPNTGEKAGEDLARRIRSAVEAYNKEHPDLLLHLSLGVATCRSPDESLEDTLKKADDLMYRNKLLNRASARNQIVGTLMAALNEKDYLCTGHAERLQEMCLKIGEKLGLSPQQIADLALLAKVHDLGKVAVPDNILFKPGPLTDEERQVMQQHPEKGYRIALSSPDLARVADLILKHHERWDGKGYPLGLKEEEIPLECRILAIADAFDAMTVERPYTKPLSKAEALRELKRCAGSQFDPRLVEVFLSLFSEGEKA